MIDAEMLDDLRETFEEAKSYVVRISGGRKRKFDCAAVDEMKGVPKQPKKDMLFTYNGVSRAKTPKEQMGRHSVESCTRGHDGEQHHKERKRQKLEGGYKKADKYRPGRRTT